MAPATVAAVDISARWMPHSAEEVVARALTVISPFTCNGSYEYEIEVCSFNLNAEIKYQCHRAKHRAWV
jgi:hypothetical protein